MISMKELARYHGTGDPHASIWFLGFEEPGLRRDLNGFRLRLEPEFVESCPKQVSSLWKIAAWVMAGLGGAGAGQRLAAGRAFLNEKLFRAAAPPAERCFAIHFHPLPRPNPAHWEESWNHRFGSRGLHDYLAEFVGARVEFLRRLFAKFQPRVVVCPASIRCNEVRWIFDLVREPEIKGPDFHVFRCERVILSPYFTPRGGMFNREKVEQLVGLVRGFL